MIAKMVSESIPGLQAAEKSHLESGKENKAHLADVETKMKKLASFDGNDNPEFPKAIGKGEKVARKNSEEENDDAELKPKNSEEDSDRPCSCNRTSAYGLLQR